MKTTLSVILLILSISTPLPSYGRENSIPIRLQVKELSSLELSLLYETRHTLRSASAYLLGTQQANGSWKNDPAITSLVLYSFLLPPAYHSEEKTEQAINKALAYIQTFVKPDGGIYDKGYKNYVTAVALLMFTEAKMPEYESIIRNAKQFLIKFQLDEGEGITETHPYYGGIGYGGDDRPDLSNTQLAIDAIQAAETWEAAEGGGRSKDPAEAVKKETERGAHWRKALVFLARTQNIKSINDMPYATDDGGFIYETGHYKKDRSQSYGSMTYAGLKSLLFAGVDKNDLRIRKAFAWICRHYTTKENPGFGTTSLYYYYMSATKCLAAMGQEVIRDGEGNQHRWREDFIKTLISLQHEEGYWVNADGRYWENIKDLTTAYAVIGIKYGLKDILIPDSLISFSNNSKK